MDFDFTEDQRMMAEVAGALLAEVSSTARLRKGLERERIHDPERWAALCEIGLPGILVPEAHGGMELAAPDFVQIATACGYHLLPEPLVELAGVVLPLLAEAGQGELVRDALGDRRLIVLARGVPVVHAVHAEAIVLAGPDGGMRLLTPAECRMTAQPHVDPLLGLSSIAAGPGAGRVLADAAGGANLLRKATDRGALWAAAQLLGIAQRAIDLGVAYAGERSQFGRPIGSYQAIKHHLASAQVKVEFARPVVHAAACVEAGSGTFAGARISHALLAAAAAADFAARTAIQTHGAMGYSWEVDVHLYLKRTLWLSHCWGSPAWHRDRVARRALDGTIGTEGLFAA